ncbi:MAG: AEC family transporter [Clostridia bacterium]|nr:AEC family transporter [Clostridia bacterium]
MTALFLTSLESVALLLLMAIPGFICAKLKMLNKAEAVKFLSVTLLYILQPFVTVNSFLNTEFNSGILLNMLAVFLFTAVTELLVLGIGIGITKAIKPLDVDSKGIISYGGAFGNLGYMCIPFLQLLAPGQHELILYASCAVVVFNLLGWTIGNYVITGDKKYMSIKKAIFNPPTLSFIIAMPLFVCNINFARFNLDGIANIFRLFADAVGPLSMTLLGIKLAEMSLKDIFLDYRTYIASGIKLIIYPIVGFLIILLMTTFMDVSDIKLNLVALSAMPVANNCMMFASMANTDTSLAAKEVMISTILSCVTIPLCIMIML